jgi:hypothetical protein
MGYCCRILTPAQPVYPASSMRDFLSGAYSGVRGVIIGLGALVFLDSVGISITPLLASLGIGTLAVALALQDTLANLFAGIYMIAEKPVILSFASRIVTAAPRACSGPRTEAEKANSTTDI